MQRDHGTSRQGEGKSEKRPEWVEEGRDKIKMRLKGGGGRANPVDLVGPFGSSQNKGTFEGVLTSGRKW